ncbi:hypothetical protein EVA_09328, partial [gut metagenome]
IALPQRPFAAIDRVSRANLLIYLLDTEEAHVIFT